MKNEKRKFVALALSDLQVEELQNALLLRRCSGLTPDRTSALDELMDEVRSQTREPITGR